MDWLKLILFTTMKAYTLITKNDGEDHLNVISCRGRSLSIRFTFELKHSRSASTNLYSETNRTFLIYSMPANDQCSLSLSIRPQYYLWRVHFSTQFESPIENNVFTNGRIFKQTIIVIVYSSHLSSSSYISKGKKRNHQRV